MNHATRRYLHALLLLLTILLVSTACTSDQEPAALEATMPATLSDATEVIPPTQTPAPTATPIPLPTTDPLTLFVSQLETALAARDLGAVEALLDSPFGFGPYRSEWTSYAPGEVTEQLGTHYLTGDAAVLFSDMDETAIASLLDGMPPRSILPPDAPVTAVIHSSGWGPTGADEGILYIYDTDAGPRWSALLYLPGAAAADGIPFQYTEVSEIITLADTVDFYAGPGTDYPVVASVFGGQRFPVAGISENGSWWKLACGDDDGLFPECWAPMDSELVQAYEESYEHVAAPAGLTYVEFDVGTWRLDDELIPRLLSTRTDLFISPAGTQAVYFDENGQLWYMDLGSAEKRQLTEAEDLNRHVVWDGESAVLTGVYLTPEEMDGPNNGHLARVAVTTGIMTVLERDALSSGQPAVSSDGTIAYDAGGSVFLLAKDQAEPSPFVAADFTGWEGEPASVLRQPAFSPDGSRLAWLAPYGERTVIAVFDLEVRMVLELHPFDPARFGGLPPGPVWNPDGTWIGVRILANGPEGTGLWLLSLDGAEQFLGYNLSDAVWLDAEHVLFSHYRYEGRTPIERVNVVTGERRELAISGNANVVAVTSR